MRSGRRRHEILANEGIVAQISMGGSKMSGLEGYIIAFLFGMVVMAIVMLALQQPRPPRW